MMRRFAYPLLLVISLLWNQAFAASSMTLEFHEPDTRPKTLLVLPVQAQLSVSRVGQNEPVIAESDAWESTTQDLLISGLKQRGYEVKVLEQEKIAADPELQELVKDVRANLAETKLKRRDIVERRFNIGGPARTLAKHQDVDALIISSVNANAQAGGALVMTALVGGGAPSMTLMNLILVDATTGDIEAHFAGSGGSVSIDKLKAADSAIIGKMVARSLKKYPASDKAVRINKKTKARAVAKQVPDVNDDDMLSELEDLIGDND